MLWRWWFPLSVYIIIMTAGINLPRLQSIRPTATPLSPLIKPAASGRAYLHVQRAVPRGTSSWRTSRRATSAPYSLSSSKIYAAAQRNKDTQTWWRCSIDTGATDRDLPRGYGPWINLNCCTQPGVESQTLCLFVYSNYYCADRALVIMWYIYTSSHGHKHFGCVDTLESYKNVRKVQWGQCSVWVTQLMLIIPVACCFVCFCRGVFRPVLVRRHASIIRSPASTRDVRWIVGPEGHRTGTCCFCTQQQLPPPRAQRNILLSF